MVHNQLADLIIGNVQGVNDTKLKERLSDQDNHGDDRPKQTKKFANMITRSAAAKDNSKTSNDSTTRDQQTNNSTNENHDNPTMKVIQKAILNLL